MTGTICIFAVKDAIYQLQLRARQRTFLRMFNECVTFFNHKGEIPCRHLRNLWITCSYRYFRLNECILKQLRYANFVLSAWMQSVEYRRSKRVHLENWKLLSRTMQNKRCKTRVCSHIEKLEQRFLVLWVLKLKLLINQQMCFYCAIYEARKWREWYDWAHSKALFLKCHFQAMG